MIQDASPLPPRGPIARLVMMPETSATSHTTFTFTFMQLFSRLVVPDEPIQQANGAF